MLLKKYIYTIDRNIHETSHNTFSIFLEIVVLLSEVK